MQYAEHGKLMVQPATEFDSATELALVSDSAHNPRFAQHPALLVDGRVAEIAILPGPIGLQGEISFAASRAGPAAIDCCLLAGLHREEHLFDPTVLEKRPNLVDDLCAHARALHRVRGSPRGACRGGRSKRSFPTWVPLRGSWLMECGGQRSAPRADSGILN